MRRHLARILLPALALAWLTGLGFGIHHLSKYESTPGAATTSAEVWPINAPAKNPAGHTLAVFLHPECPCSKATVANLDKLLAKADGKLKAYAFAVLPDGAPQEWKSSELLAHVREMKNVHLIEDQDAHFAKLFNAATSGHAALYDADGKRIFSGGITAGRGHDGPNAGAAQIEAILLGKKADSSQTPVFGCALFSATESFARPREGECPTCR
jgi:hypothetical protein